MEIFDDKNTRFVDMPTDIKKMIIIMIDLFMIPGLKNIKNMEQECAKNSRIAFFMCNNYDFWKALWMRFVSKTLPIEEKSNDNVKMLKEKYIEAMKLYELEDFKIVDWGDGEKAYNEREKILKDKKYNKMLKILKLNEKWGKIKSNKSDVMAHIAKGADINNFKYAQLSPLSKALNSRNRELVKYLIDMGADFNASDIDGWTPFNFLYFDYVIKFALDMGADVNGRGKNGDTLLMRIIYETLQDHTLDNTMKKIKLLIENGANKNIKDFHGDDIYDIIRKAVNDNPRHYHFEDFKQRIIDAINGDFSNRR